MEPTGEKKERATKADLEKKYTAGAEEYQSILGGRKDTSQRQEEVEEHC